MPGTSNVTGIPRKSPDPNEGMRPGSSLVDKMAKRDTLNAGSVGTTGAQLPVGSHNLYLGQPSQYIYMYCFFFFVYIS